MLGENIRDSLSTIFRKPRPISSGPRGMNSGRHNSLLGILCSHDSKTFPFDPRLSQVHRYFFTHKQSPHTSGGIRKYHVSSTYHDKERETDTLTHAHITSIKI